MSVAGEAAVCVLVGMAVVYVLKRARYLWAKPNAALRHADLWTYPFRTGDLILTSNRLESLRDVVANFDPVAAIKLFTESPFNHTAVAYVDPDTEQTLFWELNGTGTRMATMYDMTSGRPDHIVCVRTLVGGPPIDPRAFMAVVKAQWRYQFNMDVALAWYHRYAGRAPCVPAPFFKGHNWGHGRQATCVHMTTELYHMLGVIDLTRTGVDPAGVFAADYGRDPIDTHIIPLANGYRFGPIVRLDF